jgi:cystathionine gamma-synthase/methionine-gamma-lyase
MGRSIETSAVHAGRERRHAAFRGTSPAIEASSAFVADSVAELYGVFRGEPGVVYSRLGNPTVMALEDAVAALEGGAGSVAFGSGMAAIFAAWLACGVGRDDVVMVSHDCYGSSLTLARSVFARLGARAVELDLCDTDTALGRIARERPKVVHCEAMSNPLLRVPELAALAEGAHRAGARLSVDATFATPVLLRAFDHGADVVVHSLTKYLGGHGDATGGVCVARAPALLAALRQVVIVAGGVLSPFEAWLLLRGLRTLPLRMERHSLNALAVARRLETHPCVARVHHVGLSSHPHHERARSLFGGRYGGMLAFELAAGGREEAMNLLGRLRLVQPATTLGDVASLALHPATSSHRELGPADLARYGIAESLVRLSVGIEDVTDVLADLEQALDVAGG